MSDFDSGGLPITYVADPPVAAGSTVVSGGSVALSGQPIQVFVTGGTIGASFSFVGTVTTDIGNVKIEDQDDNYAVIPDASVAKDGSTNALVVQHIDDTGTPLRESTQVAIRTSGSDTNAHLANVDLNTYAATVYLDNLVDAQGTLATALNQIAQITELHAIHNNTGTLATSALQIAGGLTQTAILNNQGTQANSALQTDQNAKLAAILTAQGTQSTSSLAQNNVLVSVDGHVGTLATSANQTAQNLLLVALDGHQGTQATSANQVDQTAKLAAILTAQGTQSTSSLAQNSVLVQVLNNTGTLATSANQTTEIAALNSIITVVQQNSVAVAQAGTNLEVTLFSAVSTPSNSPAANVNGYTQHSIQHIVSNGSVVSYTQTSLDGINWNLESNDFTSGIVRLTGPCKYIRAVYVGGNGTLTSLLNSAKAAGSGGIANGAGAAEAEFSGSIAGALDSTYTVATNGAASIGFHYLPPTGSWTIFEGSWDGEHWTDMTLRQMGAHGYSTRTDDSHQDWIGSVSTWKYFRLRVITGGSGIGTFSGKFSYAPSTLEGIENNPMPHRIGAAVQSRGFSYSAAVSNGTLWTPSAADHRLYISDIHFTVDASTVVTFSDGSYAENKHIFRGQFKPGPGNSQYVPIAFSLPHVFSGANRPLTITSTATANVEGVVHGYEAE